MGAANDALMGGRRPKTACGKPVIFLGNSQHRIVFGHIYDGKIGISDGRCQPDLP
jgi:hypothetical protein